MADSDPQYSTTIEMSEPQNDNKRSRSNSSDQKDYLESKKPTCYCLTAKADRSLTSTLNKPDGMIMLDPTHWFMRKWVNLITILLLFVAFVTPFEVAFLSTKPDLLFVINRFVDIGFIVDMIFQFFLPYYDSDDLVYVWNRDLIALNYAKLWFPLDLVSVLPYDFFGGDPFASIEVIEGDASSTEQLKVLRLVRLLRLIKLARVFKSAKIFTVLQVKYEMTFVGISLIKLGVLCIVLLHWFACLWGLAAGFEAGTINWINGGGMLLADLGDLYAGAFEYSLQAMVNGYGDFVPHSTGERALTLLLMIIGSALYGYAIGEICDKTGNLNPAQQEFQQNMDLLNQYMTEIKLPPHRMMEFRQFFSFNKENFKNRFFIDVLMDKMSPDLQGMLAAYQHGAWIRKIPFFNAKSSEERRVFITKVAMCLDARSFSPGEVIYHEGDLANEMYIVQKGLAATKGYVISEGNFFGENFVLPGARRGSSSRALTYLATYGLKYDDPEVEDEEGEIEGGKGIIQLIEKYGLHETKRLIRKKAIQLAVKSRFIQILMLVRTRPDYKPMKKEDVEHWKNLNQAKTYLRMHERKQNGGMSYSTSCCLADLFEGSFKETKYISDSFFVLFFLLPFSLFFFFWYLISIFGFIKILQMIRKQINVTN